MARPPAPLTTAARTVLSEAAQALTWRALADQLGRRGLINPAAPGEAELVRVTLKNLLRGGRVARGDPVHVPGISRPMTTYVARPAIDQAAQKDAAQALAQAMHGWQSC